MAFTDTAKIGVDLDRVYKVGEVPPQSAHKPGEQIFASDGKRYVFAVADATIAASTAVCNVDSGTFKVAATGGSYKSPATAMAKGDMGWFGAASV